MKEKEKTWLKWCGWIFKERKEGFFPNIANKESNFPSLLPNNIFRILYGHFFLYSVKSLAPLTPIVGQNSIFSKLIVVSYLNIRLFLKNNEVQESWS
jgi:hypothetical protein